MALLHLTREARDPQDWCKGNNPAQMVLAAVSGGLSPLSQCSWNTLYLVSLLVFFQQKEFVWNSYMVPCHCVLY